MKSTSIGITIEMNAVIERILAELLAVETRAGEVEWRDVQRMIMTPAPHVRTMYSFP